MLLPTWVCGVVRRKKGRGFLRTAVTGFGAAPFRNHKNLQEFTRIYNNYKNLQYFTIVGNILHEQELTYLCDPRFEALASHPVSHRLRGVVDRHGVRIMGSGRIAYGARWISWGRLASASR